VPRNALEPSPDLRRRTAALSAYTAATPSQPPPLAASPSRKLRLGASCALNRALELEIEFAGEITAPCHRSPLAAGYCPAADRLHTFLATGSRSDAPDSIEQPHLNPYPLQPLDLDQADPSKLVKPRRPWKFRRKPLKFSNIYKNTLPP
jgi:hypothetical protein